MDKRIVKIPMPIELILKMDEALAAGIGGMENREQFIREATEGLLAELAYPAAPPEPEAPSRPSSEAPAHQAPMLPAGAASVPPWEQEELRLMDLPGSALPSIPPGISLSTGVVHPVQEPLLGLHNRDYPSLWAAGRLARYTEDDLISVGEFWRRVTAAAWFYGAQLQVLEQRTRGLRLTPIFPTNHLKQEAAEQAFQTFALGEVPRRSSSENAIKAGGPFFDWGLCQLQREGAALLIGLTDRGRALLEALAGLTLKVPHEEAEAQIFLNYLFANSPGERWGFERILESALEEPSREELVAAIAEDKGEWTEAIASSVAQGYVARAREWGLLEPRLQQGRYRLTDFGRRWRGENAGSTQGDDQRREVE